MTQQADVTTNLATLGATGFVINANFTQLPNVDRQIVVPADAGTTVCQESGKDLDLDLNHTGTIAAHTVRLPVGHLSMVVTMYSRAAITTLTINAIDAKAVLNAPVTFAIGDTVKFKQVDANTWAKI